MPAVISGVVGLIDQWLVGLLLTDSVLVGYGLTGVYAGMTPEGATPPWIVLVDASGQDTTGMATTYILTTAAWWINCVHMTDDDQIPVQMAHRVKQLVQGRGPGLYQDGLIYSAQREQVLMRRELLEGVQWRTAMQLFSIIVQEGS